MTTKQQLRKAALALPEVQEGTHFGMLAFEVRGKGFASLTDDGLVQLQLADDDVASAVTAHPTGERLVRMGTPIGFRVPLADINGRDLNILVHAAWRHRAPKRLVQGTEQKPVDLPVGIGKPATRALTEAGITTLDRVADHTEAELAALHGVGPKAIRVLRDALAERGTQLR